jgi:DNA repair ATPase RecN
VITGPTGVGKSTILAAASDLLAGAVSALDVLRQRILGHEAGDPASRLTVDNTPAAPPARSPPRC